MNKNKRISFIEKNKKRDKLINILPLKMPLGLNIGPINVDNLVLKNIMKF
jgi:hypothetical protein